MKKAKKQMIKAWNEFKAKKKLLRKKEKDWEERYYRKLIDSVTEENAEKRQLICKEFRKIKLEYDDLAHEYWQQLLEFDRSFYDSRDNIVDR